MIDPIHFQDLAEKDPADVCRRALCRYDEVERKYTVSVWGEDIAIFPHRSIVESMADKPHHREDVFHLFAIHYLLGAQETDVSGSWISEKEVPGGATFFQGPHRIPTDGVTKRFHNDIDEFVKRCEQLGGEPVRMADAAYTFRITHRIPVVVLYWRGDDEFAAECKILYDRTIDAHLATDVIYALAVGICRKLKEG